MFNVTVINVKKTLKYGTALIIALLIMYISTMNISKIENKEIMKINISEKLIGCIVQEIPAIENTYYKANNCVKEDNIEQDTKETFVSKILDLELTRVKERVITEEKEIIANEVIEPTESETVETNAEIQNITKNPITESFNTEINGVKIKNETSFEINDSIINNNLEINKNNILIFHTHTCESYTPSEKYQYEQTGNYRTTDPNYSVIKVGKELCDYLNKYNFNVYHNETYHDYPAYTGSYTRSKASVETDLKENPSDIIIDLHRDAIGSKSNYDPSIKIGEDEAAQLMFVIGTNGGGLYHPDWKNNLSFAIEIQQKANELYPGLFKPIIVRNSRYNQHLGKAAVIIEVGATGNTLDQTLTSMKYLSKIFEQVLK